MVDLKNKVVDSAGDFRLNKGNILFHEWKANTGKENIAFKDGGSFTFQPPYWEHIPKGYTIPGSVNFTLRDDGTITDIHGQPIRDSIGAIASVRWHRHRLTTTM